VLAAQPQCDDRGKAPDDKPVASMVTHFFSMSQLWRISLHGHSLETVSALQLR